MSEDISVSVICNAYNHEDYIRDALEGFIMQKTNFKFEILVHDDASTDNTADIIREYEKKYPHLIKPIYQVENQYSKGTGLVGKTQLARAKGKYIAMCEGDDYWTDPYKLQKQFDAMEKNPQVDICAHGAVTIDASTKKIEQEIKPKEYDTIIPPEEVISGGGGYVVTCSLFYRKSINDNFPEFRKILTFDYTLQICGSLRGGMLYLNDCMSVYRILSKNSWSSRMSQDISSYIKHLQRVHEMFKVLNEETEYRYNNIINEKLLQNEFKVLILSKKYKELKKAPYDELYKSLTLKKRLKINIKQCLAIVRGKRG